MENLICKLVYDEKTNSTHFESAEAVNGPSEYLPDLIEYDKKFGKLPIPDGIASYNTFGGLPRGMDELKFHTAIDHALRRILIYTKEIRKISYEKNNPDTLFKFYVRTRAEDPNLNYNTIMYAYYALSSPHQNRGVIVINKDSFYYTPSGDSMSMYLIAPEHYPENTTARGSTIDIDQVIAHELMHSLGFPHDPKNDNILSAYYSSMNEYLTQRDIARLHAKYQKRNVASSYLQGFLARLHRYSNIN